MLEAAPLTQISIGPLGICLNIAKPRTAVKPGASMASYNLGRLAAILNAAEFYFVVSARVLRNKELKQYQSLKGQLTVVIFLTGNGILTFAGASSSREIEVQHGSSFVLRGADYIQKVTWDASNEFLEIVIDDFFFSKILKSLPLNASNLENIFCHYGPEADFGPLASRLARKISSDLHSSASLVRDGLHCPATARFILAMMLKTRDPRHFKLEIQSPRLKLSETRYKKVAQHIEQKLTNSIHVSELASIASQSHFHFTRTFKARTGQSPHIYILERRLRRAEYLLAETDIGLAQISQECGFSSQSHFSTAFKQHVGITPGQYREQCF